MKRQASGQVVSIPWERRLGGGQVTGVGAGYGREGKWLGREKPLLSSSPGWTLRQGAFEEEVGEAGRAG